MTKRSKFLTVLFSFLPGAGHMYLGFMKMGLSFMTMLFGITAIAIVLNTGIVALAIPVLWFYSFFDCINKAFPTDEAAIIEDKYILLPEPFPIFNGKHRLILGIGLALIGVYVLADNVFRLMSTIDYGWYSYHQLWRVRDALRSLPQVIIALVIVVVGITMIAGKKKELGAKQESGEN